MCHVVKHAHDFRGTCGNTPITDSSAKYKVQALHLLLLPALLLDSRTRELLRGPTDSGAHHETTEGCTKVEQDHLVRRDGRDSRSAVRRGGNSTDNGRRGCRAQL